MIIFLDWPYSKLGPVRVTDSLIEINQSKNGGGIYSIPGTVGITGTNVLTNVTANHRGGGIFSEAGTLSIA